MHHDDLCIFSGWPWLASRCALKLIRVHLAYRLVVTYGEGSWSKLVPYFSGRIGKQLRERWNHELRPDIQKGAWTEEEERALVEQHRVHKNAWADIARVRRAFLHLQQSWCCSLRLLEPG